MAPRDRRKLFALAALLCACGPIEYVNQVTRRADSAVAAARVAEAETYSPYWWTRATEYLRQARVEAAAADFQAANRFGRLATEAAEKARAEALRAAADPDFRERQLPPPAPAPAPRPAPVRKADDAPAADGDAAAPEVTP
jgi:hypothetical protein